MGRFLGTVAASLLVALVGGAGPVSASTSPQGTLALQSATADAVRAVGGGTVTHVSRDTYHSQPVYDVHVLDAGRLWDVLVRMDGTTTNKHLVTEQPSATGGNAGGSTPAGGTVPATSAAAAEQIAVHAVGGGSAVHTSADHAGGAAVWDVHVLAGGILYTVKVSQATGAVLSQGKSGEQPGTEGTVGVGRTPQGTGRREAEGSPAPASAPGGLAYGRKYGTPPAEFTAAAQAAVAAVGGVSLKWVKFTAAGSGQGSGDIQANIKIRLAHGTTKVKDIFTAAGSLIAQRTQSDH